MIGKRKEIIEECRALSQGFKRQLKHINNLSQLRQQLSRELGRINHDNQDDISTLLRSLATILSIESDREQLREDYLTEFNQLFEQIINKKAEQKQISEWYKRRFAKMSVQGRKLRHALVCAHDLNVKLANSEFEAGLATEKYAQIQGIVQDLDQEISELETLIEGGHGETRDHSYKEKLPHLFKIADFIERNTLTQTESEVVHEIAQKSMWLMGSEQFQHYEIQAHCQAIEQLTRRFTKSPNQLIENICALLKVQMHLVELLSKKQTGSRNVAELEAINHQVIEKLMSMKMETEHLVRNISMQGQQALSLDQHGQLLDVLSDDAQSGNISGDIESHYELNKKKLQEYESKFINLNTKIVERTSEVESLRRSREQSRYREESHSNRIQFLESENASLKANMQIILSTHQNSTMQEREIERLQLELTNINAQLDILTQNETRDQAQISRLKMLITDYEQQQNTSRRQLQELIARVNFRYDEKRQIRGNISDRTDLSEEFMRIRLRQLEQEVEVYISVNEVYVENQRNLEAKLEELQKQNSKLTKKKNKLEQQLKEYNLMSQSVSRDTYFLPNTEDYHSLQQTSNNDWKSRQKQLNDKILRLTFSLETIKSEYLEQVRRRGATTENLEEISKQQGGFIDDRIELFTEKRVFEDDNCNLLQSLDRAQVQISELEKKQRKLLKSEKEKIKLIEHLQRENLQLSNPREHEVFDTQRTTELTGRQKGDLKNEQSLKELQQLRSKIKLLQQQKDFYVKAIEDQVISSKTVEYESRLEECASRNQQLEKAIAIKDQQIRMLISQQPGHLNNNLQVNGLIHQGIHPYEAKYQQEQTQNIILTHTIKKPEIQVRLLQQRLDKLNNEHNNVLQENQQLDKQVRRLESELNNLQHNQPFKEQERNGPKEYPSIGKLPLRQSDLGSKEQSSQSHPINDVTVMKQRLIDLIGWSRLKPLFSEYVRLKRSETLIQIQLLLNS